MHNIALKVKLILSILKINIYIVLDDQTEGRDQG